MATSTYPATLPPLPFYEERPDGCHEGEAVSLERYLNTMYHPDCDYIDGHLEERNVGEIEHNRIQKRLLSLFIQHEAEWQVEVLQEQRMQVSPTNFRIPDVMVLRADHSEHRIVRHAPILLIEVFSPEDSIQRLHERVRDYVKMGVEHIWAFDPANRTAYHCDAADFHIVAEDQLTVPNTLIRLKVADVFSALDR